MHEPAPEAGSRPCAGPGKRIVTVVEFIGPEGNQPITQPSVTLASLKHVYLQLIVLINEGFHRGDRTIDRSGPEEGRQRAEQKAGNPPQRRQLRMPLRRQFLKKKIQVRLFSRLVRLRERTQYGVAGHGEHTPIDPDRAELAGMVAAKFAQHGLG